MLKLNTLRPHPGSLKKKKRVGRGTSSGHGKTSGRGNKGQKSRSGGTKGPFFEGGQTPIYRRLPKKRGFKNFTFRKLFREITINALNRFEREVKVEDFVKANFARPDEQIKILGSGELKKALSVTAHKFTKGAKEKIEKAGGKAVVC